MQVKDRPAHRPLGLAIHRVDGAVPLLGCGEISADEKSRRSQSQVPGISLRPAACPVRNGVRHAGYRSSGPVWRAAASALSRDTPMTRPQAAQVST